MARSMFARYLDLAQVNKCVALLEAAAEQAFPKVSPGATAFEYRAPDGDIVFAGLEKEAGQYICRLHREVFAE